MESRGTKRYSLGEEIAHAVTHGIGTGLAVAALSILVTFAGLYGDAWRVGYEGKCPSEIPDAAGELPVTYENRYERYEMSSHIVEVSSAHKFAVMNGNVPDGVYELAEEKCRYYPLPVPTDDEMRSIHAQALGYRISNSLGAFQELDGKVWYCTSFSGGEGGTGVGMLGYFDLKTKKYEVALSSSVDRWPCTALLAEKDKVRIGLDYRGGVAELDKVSGVYASYEVPATVNLFKRVGGSLVLGTQSGIYLLDHAGKVTYLGPEVVKDGKLRVK